MAHSTLNPRDIVANAVSGRYDIPEFQRGFVWKPEKVKHLLDSLCRAYPLGAILCWRHREYQQARFATGTEPDRSWIVDGQQRATALCLLLGKKPYWFPSPDPWEDIQKRCTVLVNLASPNSAEPELNLPNPVLLRNTTWISARELFAIPETEVAPRAIALLSRIGKTPTDTEDLTRVMTIIQTLHAAMKRELVAIEIDHDPVDVAEIFGRLNSAGTKVNEGDIALALVAVRQPGWVKEGLLPYLDDLKERGFEFDPSFVVRAMTAIRRGSTRLREVPREVWEGGNEFDAGWKRTTTAVANTIKVLREEGVLDADVLPSRNALIPLFVFDDKHAHGDAALLRRGFLWMLKATRDGRYSGSATTTMDQDVLTIRSAADADTAIVELEKRLTLGIAVKPEDLLKRYDEDDFLLLLLYLAVFHNGAEDWTTGQKLGFDRSENALNDRFRPEWHHFVPRGLLRRRQPTPPPEDLINALANIVALGESDNRKFSMKPPHTYLAKHKVPDERVHQQFFPDRALWTPDVFEKFVQARAEILATAMNAYAEHLLGATTPVGALA